MAIQPADRNVAVVDILGAFDALVPDRGALAVRTGWSPAVIDTIDAYRGSDLRYSFPTQAELGAALDADLALIASYPGDTETDRYPTLVWAPR